VTPLTRDQLDSLAGAATLSAPMVFATVSRPQPDTTLCRVTGTVNLVTAPALAEKVSQAARHGRPHLVIDLSAVASLDPLGLQAVLETLDSCGIDGHLAVVMDPRSEAATRPEVVELHEVLDLHHDVASALRACARAFVSTGGRHRAPLAS
jgi:anti-anti-sigma factor